MNEIILLKLGELVLKGLNRRTFEDRLVANARRRLQAHGKFKVYTKQSTMYVEPQSEDCDLDGAWEAMTKLFGVVGLSRARACAKDKDAMLQTAVEYLGDRLAAAKTPGKTGDNLLIAVERRLDNVVYRMGFAMTRRQARQLVSHAHFTVNGRKVDIPSYQVKAGDVIEVAESSRSSEIFKRLLGQDAPVFLIPAWMEREKNALKGTVTRLPAREDIDVPVEEHLIVELYSK